MSVKITFTEFRTLPRQEQCDVIVTIGDYLESSREEDKQVILYAVDLFFVELYYDPTSNKILKIRAFKSGHILDKYSKDFNGIMEL